MASIGVLTPFSLMDDVCNKKRLSLIGTNAFSDFSIGKYMFNRWLSMTSLRNLLVADLMNGYDSADDKELCYACATALAGGCGRFKYLKKPSQKREPKIDEVEFAESVSKREREFYLDTMSFIEDAERHNEDRRNEKE